MAGILLVCLSGSLVRSASGNLLLADPLTFAPRLGNMTAPFTYLKSPLASGGECEIPSWVQCRNAPDFCCEAGEICQPAIFNCCPSSALQCDGRSCCDAATSICCLSVSTGCCAKDSICCGPNCCPSDYTCSGGRCLPPTTPTPSKTTQVPGCTLGPGRRAQGQACETESATASTDTPVPTVKPLVFDYDRLISKKKKYNTQQKNERREAIYQLFKNMCIGLVKRGKVQSETYTFVNDEKTKYENRKDAGCTGSPCAHLVGHSCDEFPFASTTAGGIGAHWDCIPEKGQDIQGGVMGYWVSRSKVVAGSIFELQIVNFDCANPPPPPPPLAGSLLGSGGGTLKSSSRVDTSSNATILSMNQDVYPPFDESDSNNHTIISLGSLSAGSYNISANVSGVVSSAYIVDSEGAQFAQITAENGVAMTLSFNLPFDNIGIVLVMDTQADQINYNASLVVVDNTAPPSASPRPSAGGSTTPSSARSIRSGGAAAYMAGFFGFCIFF